MSKGNTIDHFKVYVVSAGGNKLVATITADPSFPEYKYTYSPSRKSGGRISFQIVPVDLRFVSLEQIQSNSLTFPTQMSSKQGSKSRIVSISASSNVTTGDSLLEKLEKKTRRRGGKEKGIPKLRKRRKGSRRR